MTVLIDTNVILDHILMRKNSETARDCLEWLCINKHKSYLTSNIITDIYYFVQRELKNPAKSKDVIAKLLNAFQVVNVDKTDCVNALHVGFDDYEDGLAFVCAKKIKAGFIITQNTGDYANSTIQALTPADFIAKFNQK